ncbi:MAG: hypothetical protein AABY51_09330 [Deltaproteobacteria bacterium]
MKGNEGYNANRAGRSLIGCALVFTGGLNSLLAIKSGEQIGPVSYLFIIAGTALLLYGVWSRTKS